MTVMFHSPISSSSSFDTSWSHGSASENGDVHTVENFVLCSFAHHVCSPLLQGDLREEELCKVTLTCRFALDVIFLSQD